MTLPVIEREFMLCISVILKGYTTVQKLGIG